MAIRSRTISKRRHDERYTEKLYQPSKEVNTSESNEPPAEYSQPSFERTAQQDFREKLAEREDLAGSDIPVQSRSRRSKEERREISRQRREEFKSRQLGEPEQRGEATRTPIEGAPEQTGAPQQPPTKIQQRMQEAKYIGKEVVKGVKAGLLGISSHMAQMGESVSEDISKQIKPDEEFITSAGRRTSEGMYKTDEETGHILAKNKSGEWIDTGKKAKHTLPKKMVDSTTGLQIEAEDTDEDDDEDVDIGGGSSKFSSGVLGGRSTGESTSQPMGRFGAGSDIYSTGFTYGSKVPSGGGKFGAGKELLSAFEYGSGQPMRTQRFGAGSGGLSAFKYGSRTRMETEPQPFGAGERTYSAFKYGGRAPQQDVQLFGNNLNALSSGAFGRYSYNRPVRQQPYYQQQYEQSPQEIPQPPVQREGLFTNNLGGVSSGSLSSISSGTFKYNTVPRSQPQSQQIVTPQSATQERRLFNGNMGAISSGMFRFNHPESARPVQQSVMVEAPPSQQPMIVQTLPIQTQRTPQMRMPPKPKGMSKKDYRTYTKNYQQQALAQQQAMAIREQQLQQLALIQAAQAQQVAMQRRQNQIGNGGSILSGLNEVFGRRVSW